MTNLISAQHAQPAPAWSIARWLQGPPVDDLASLRGRVVLVHAFQMLCPGCVAHGLPQAQRIADVFDPREVVVVGLHTVFEHHEAMGPLALEAFVHEYALRIPVAIDAPSATGPLPQTFEAFGLRGTPSLVLIDHEGRVRMNAFGRLDDLVVGAAVATVMAERSTVTLDAGRRNLAGRRSCDDEACVMP